MPKKKSSDEIMRLVYEIIYLQDEIYFLKEKVKVLEEGKEQLQNKYSDSQRYLTRIEKAPSVETAGPRAEQ